MNIREAADLLGLTTHGPDILIAGTCLMAAASWWCQLWRYPDFGRWSEQEFARRHSAHVTTISLIVIPGMLLQIAGSGMLQMSRGFGWLSILSWICLAGSLLPTFLVSGPIHGRLSKARNLAEIERLNSTNLPRTVVWTAHLLIALIWKLSS